MGNDSRIQVVANEKGFSVGMTVRVKESVKVYHIPNSGEGIDMKDRQGVIVADATKQEVHIYKCTCVKAT